MKLNQDVCVNTFTMKSTVLVFSIMWPVFILELITRTCVLVFMSSLKMPVSKVRNDLSSSVQKFACLWRPVTVKDNRTQKLFSRLFVIVEAYNAWFHSTQMRVAMFVSTFGNKIASSCCCMWPCLCSVSLWCLWRDRKIRDVFQTENFF